MKKFAFMIRQNSIRWIFLFGVLAGLFFSGGKGIQLLPFPMTEDCNSKNNASVLENNQKSYAFSLHKSGSHLPLLRSKFQKHSDQHPVADHLIFDWASCRAELFLQSSQNRENANFSLASVFLILQSDRAPPTV